MDDVWVAVVSTGGHDVGSAVSAGPIVTFADEAMDLTNFPFADGAVGFS